jgi:predicted GNAT family N-acyltransferase
MISNEKYQVNLVTTKDQFAEAIKVRVEVFIDEQKCPPDTEPDEKDEICIHWLLISQSSDKPLGTIRLVPISETECALGRLCLAKEARGKGLGKLLVRTMEQAAIAKGYKTISLHAQCDKLGFYNACGYTKIDLPEFLEDGILHFHMVKHFD